MKNILKIENHTAVISYDPEIDMLRGEFINLNGGADFYASSLEQLKKRRPFHWLFSLMNAGKTVLHRTNHTVGKSALA